MRQPSPRRLIHLAALAACASLALGAQAQGQPQSAEPALPAAEATQILEASERKAHTRHTLTELADIQRKILDAAAPLVRPGGLLVYATCSLLAQENSLVQQAFSDAHPQFEVVDPVAHLASVGIELPADAQLKGPTGLPGLQLLPHCHNTDGFFAAVWRKKI